MTYDTRMNTNYFRRYIEGVILLLYNRPLAWTYEIHYNECLDGMENNGVFKTMKGQRLLDGDCTALLYAKASFPLQSYW